MHGDSMNKHGPYVNVAQHGYLEQEDDYDQLCVEVLNKSY